MKSRFQISNDKTEHENGDIFSDTTLMTAICQARKVQPRRNAAKDCSSVDLIAERIQNVILLPIRWMGRSLNGNEHILLPFISKLEKFHLKPHIPCSMKYEQEPGWMSRRPAWRVAMHYFLLFVHCCKLQLS
uniref:Uncharacterized protein n=1 Tax=Trichuris muris TaxID=70415 RepID=A0A5S6R1C3_TRIMR